MSDAATQPNTPPTTSSPPSTEPQHGRGLWNSGFKIEDDAPVADHWKGKNARQILEEAERLRQEATEWKGLAMNQQQQYQQPANQQAFSYQQSNTPTFPSNQLLIENPGEYDRQLQQFIAYSNQQSAQAAVQAASQHVSPQLASTGRYLSQSDPRFKEVWERYGSEIEREMMKANLPAHQQNKDAWDFLAKVVRGEHLDEIAADKARKMSEAGGFGTEGASNASAAPTLQSDPLATFWNTDHEWVRRAKDSGMTLQSLRKHVETQNVPPDKWVEDLTRGRSFSAEAA
jgi:hypothetical protein